MLALCQRGWTWLTASRKRFSLVLSVVIVGLLLWSRLIMLSNMPRTAVAEDEPSDKPSLPSAQEKPDVESNGAPHDSVDDETGSVSNSSPDAAQLREERK